MTLPNLSWAKSRVLPLIVVMPAFFFSTSSFGQPSASGISNATASKPQKQVGKRAAAVAPDAVLAAEQEHRFTVGSQPRTSIVGVGEQQSVVTGGGELLGRRAGVATTPATQSMRCNPGKLPDRFGECR